MENQPKPTPPSDEIDIGHLFRMIGNAFNRIFRGFLRFFLFIQRNLLKLGILIIVGLLIGFALNFLISKKLKTEIIVKPNFESKNYLYDVVAELQANIEAKDTTFFNSIGVNVEHIQGFRIEIEAIEEEEEAKDPSLDLQYLALLENYKDQGFAQEVIKAEIFKKSALKHRITTYYEDGQRGQQLTKSILSYINGNPYFDDLKKVHRENALSRIDKNNNLIAQIDDIVTNFSKGLTEREGGMAQNTVFLGAENGLNIAGLLALKNRLIKEIEDKKMEVVEQNNTITVINFGRTQEVLKPFFNQNIVAIPIYLILLFLILSIIGYLSRRAKELQ